MTLAALKDLFYDAGCRRLYAKILAANDNSKNQVYFCTGFSALNLFPHEDVSPDGRLGNATFKAKVRFGWLLQNGHVDTAPGAQMILYPQYPEVRFSGFLRGVRTPPSVLMRSRQPGRVLFVGVTANSNLVGYVVGPDSAVAKEFALEGGNETLRVFKSLALTPRGDDASIRSKVISKLRTVCEKGWIDSVQLDSHGELTPCGSPQCGGFTLEAMLDIPKNSAATPDYLGWEIKQHTVSNFARPASGAPITLMTPQPTDGFYKEHGVEAFIREFGYSDRKNRPDRMNFGGKHVIGIRHPLTGLTLELNGFDPFKREITDSGGSIALVDDRGRIAAAWGFAGLLSHWSRKHAKAVYVPSRRRLVPKWQYEFGSKIRMAEGTDSLRLLDAFAVGFAFYDPGMKIENVSTTPKLKTRSQFRISSKDIPELYEKVSVVDVFADG